MTVLDNLRRKNPMPNVSPKMPTATMPTVRTEYDDEVLRVAHKQLEAVRTIASLQEERDAWKRDCLSAQTEIERLNNRIAKDADEAETRLGKVTQELDYWKGECTRVEAIMQAGSRVFLQALEHKRSDRPNSDAASTAGLAAVADAVAGIDPLPRVVAAGPMTDPN